MDKIKNFPEHFISMDALDRFTIEKTFQQANDFKISTASDLCRLLEHKTLGVMFFDSSTRTRLTFETAMYKLGGKVIGFSNKETTRSEGFFKESFTDAIRVVGEMVDGIVFRSSQTAVSKQAVTVSPVPIINGGDGANEHPTQALLDMWVIYQSIGKLDNIKIGLVGDPNWRSMRSLIIGLSKFNNVAIFFLIPPNKTLSKDIIAYLNKKKIKFSIMEDIESLLGEVDVVEMVPFFLPQFDEIQNQLNYETINFQIDSKYVITKEKLNKVNREIPILHIGPRGQELDIDLSDKISQVKYLDQIRSSIFIRMVLLFNLIK